MALTISASCDFVVWTTKDIHIEEAHCYSMSTSHPECDEPKKKQNIWLP